MVKPSRSDVQNGFWNEGEDEKTIVCVSKQHGTGQRKSGKNHNKEKWSSNQKNDPKHKSFTPQEEELVIQLHSAIGSRWPIIAQQLPGKTDNDVKILWNSKLRKKLTAMGIDPVTHKPFSQILADYGNIGAAGFPAPKGGCRTTSSLSRDLKNVTLLKPQLHDFSSSTQCKVEPQCETSSSVQDHQVDVPSFSWSDFFLEDAFLQASDVQEDIVEYCDEGAAAANKLGASASSNSTNSSFVEAMIGSQDEIFSHLPSSYEEPFYY